ncbi:MAG: hypothetical protein J5772_04665 [Clostridia bacterium]|nr:hypothetical protein [Clostridia bacterium]
MESFFTWQTLMTYSGATLATTLVTQFIKELPFMRKVPPRLISFAAALIMITLAGAASGGFGWREGVLALINAAAVALAANGAFDAITEQ